MYPYDSPRHHFTLALKRAQGDIAPLHMLDQADTPRIAELRNHVGQPVTIRGWVTHVRSSGKVAFAVIRDGTGIMQSVFVKTQLPPETWERFKELTLETSVAVTGEVRAEPRA